MIKYVKHHFIDRSKYDHCVRMDERGLVYGYSWYLDTVCDAWDALVLDDYAAVWPLPARRKFGITYFYRPYGVQQLGIFSKTSLDDKVLAAFIAEMQRHCWYADVYLNEEQIPVSKSIHKIKLSLNLNLVLDLGKTYQEVYSGYNQNTKRNIKKAQKNKLELFEQDSPKALLRSFRSHRGDELQLSEDFYKNMEQLMFRCLHNHTGRIWTVYGENNSLLAGAFFVDTEKRSTLLFSAITPEGREQQAMFFLLNEFFIYESGKGRLFDFEGSNNEALARFYKGFGSREQRYVGLRYNGLALPLKWLGK